MLCGTWDIYRVQIKSSIQISYKISVPESQIKRLLFLLFCCTWQSRLPLWSQNVLLHHNSAKQYSKNISKLRLQNLSRNRQETASPRPDHLQILVVLNIKLIHSWVSLHKLSYKSLTLIVCKREKVAEWTMINKMHSS